MAAVAVPSFCGFRSDILFFEQGLIWCGQSEVFGAIRQSHPNLHVFAMILATFDIDILTSGYSHA
jgi:hypothetical protein